MVTKKEAAALITASFTRFVASAKFTNSNYMNRFLWRHEGIVFEDHIKCTETQSRALALNTHMLHTQVLFLQSSSAVWFDKILGRTRGWPFYPRLVRLLCERPAARNQATALLKRPQVCLWAPRALRGVENVTNVPVLRHRFPAGRLDPPVQTGCTGTVLSPNSILVQTQQKLCSV